MSTITSELAALLSGVERPGDFYTAGTEEIFSPRLEVDGVGPVALPLLHAQAEALMAVAERAPHGRGEETVLDEKVRRTWQIEAERVHIGGRHWEQSLKVIAAKAAEGLGVAGPVQPEFYKLLVYGEGDFFVSHRDTEKSPGMFATLVIVLPSNYTGGELVVRHQGREIRLDMRREDPSEAAFAAFYADCLHEVLPITSGCRLTLIYNLLRKSGPLPEPPDYRTEQGRVSKLLRHWTDASNTPEGGFPEKIVYPLQHAYTPAEEALKGADAAAAAVLKGAARHSGCELHLALLSIEESGSAEHTGFFGSRWSRREEDADEFEVVEVIGRNAKLSNWVRPDSAPCALQAIPFEEEEVSPPEALDDMEPDEEHFQEATGNEGAFFERTYRRAALTLWPTAQRLAVLNKSGISDAGAANPFEKCTAHRGIFGRRLRKRGICRRRRGRHRPGCPAVDGGKDSRPDRAYHRGEYGTQFERMRPIARAKHGMHCLLEPRGASASLFKKRAFPRCIGRTKGGLNSKLARGCGSGPHTELWAPFLSPSQPWLRALSPNLYPAAFCSTA